MSLLRLRTPCQIMRAKQVRTMTGKIENEGFEIRPTKCLELNLSTELQQSSVRTDQSASGGRAEESVDFTHLMMHYKERVKIGDLIKIDIALDEPRTLRVERIRTRVDVNGRKHHIEVQCSPWE